MALASGPQEFMFMKIGRQLYLTFTATVLATLALGLVGLANLNGVKALEEAIYRENIEAQAHLSSAAQDYLKMRYVIRDLIFAADDAKVLEYRKTLYAFDEDFRAQMKAYRLASGVDRTGGDLAAALDEFQTAYESYQKLLEDLFTRVQAEDHAGAVDQLYTEGATTAQTMTAQMDSLLAFNRRSLDDRWKQSLDVVTAATWSTLGFLALSTLLGLGAAAFLTRRLARPLARAADLTRRLSEGDLTARPPRADLRRTDEVGTLNKAVEALGLGLTDFVRTLKQTGTAIETSARSLHHRADEAAEASGRISTVLDRGRDLAHDQAAGVTETTATVAQIAGTIEKFDRLIATQAASVTQSSSSLEEMASSIRSLSARADRLKEAFEGLRASSDDGREKLHAVLERIEGVHAQSSRLAEANDTIRGIASQTNLLSMNAAIEAAHAGHAGAGFAVVADEIRKLAEESASRSKDITREVEAIQGLITQTSADSQVARQAFDAVLDRVRDLGRFEAELTSALAEQDLGARQILTATGQVHEVTQEVRRGSSEILEGSQAIHREMDSLLDLSRRLEARLTEVEAEGRAVRQVAVGVQADAAQNRSLSAQLDEIVAVFQTEAAQAG